MCFNYSPKCSPDDYKNSTVEPKEDDRKEDSYEPDISIGQDDEEYEDWLLEKDQEYMEWLFGMDQT